MDMIGKYLDYLRSSREYIFITAIIFLLSLIAGLLISLKYPEMSVSYLKEFEASFGWVKDLDPLLILMIIFVNNALKSLMALVTGVGLGIIPVFFVIGNGLMLSMIADAVSREHGTLFVLSALLPHGIIEIPLILISTGIGLRLGHLMYLSLTGHVIGMKQELRMSMGFFFRIIAPLLFLAAIIETFVTPYIIAMF